MQRYPFQLGAAYYQFIGGEHVPKEQLATWTISGLRDSSRNHTQRISGLGDRDSVCSLWATDDSQRYPSPRRTPVLCAVAHTALSRPLGVAKAGTANFQNHHRPRLSVKFTIIEEVRTSLANKIWFIR